MTTILIIVGLYLLVSVIIAARLYIVAIDLLKRISPVLDTVLTAKDRFGFMRSAMLDGLGWGYYVVRYGVKTFYDELKKL